ncbi:MAG: hypothetical protein GF317_08850 [Candidatus Lokiarchaeota archaeon]|nr:hypothetical protein [Candidatus Lokiarchaeota archaeon]MBD3199819.1 hypothetical protein [Candidatus Lokiarchaeota archaeon]
MVRPYYWPENGQPWRTKAFQWIEKDVIAASWWPDPYVFEIYKREGIKVIINCSEFDNKEDVPDHFDYFHINIPDYGIPTNSQISRFLKITNISQNEKKPIVVHCVAGCGRTGQLLVAWGVHNKVIVESMDPVKWIRSHRKCSLETEEQKRFARKIAKKIH